MAYYGSTLELAARIAEEQGGGVVSTAKAYKTLLAGVPVEQMTPAMRKIAGVTEAGAFKELTPGAGARNYWGKLNQLSPMSQATEFINIGTQNADLDDASIRRALNIYAPAYENNTAQHWALVKIVREWLEIRGIK